MSDLLGEVRDRRRLPQPAMARAIRETAGVSQERVAEELGVHPVTVYRWEKGTRRPRGRLLRSYADLLAQLSEAAS